MSGILVGKYINGISLNGLEYLLDKDGVEPMRFQSENVAKAFLREHGLIDEQMEDMWFVEEDDGEGKGKISIFRGSSRSSLFFFVLPFVFFLRSLRLFAANHSSLSAPRLPIITRG